MWDRYQRGEIKDQKGGIWNRSPLGSGVKRHGIGIRDEKWDQGRKLVTLLESRIRNLRTKMGSAMKKHTSLPPCLQLYEKIWIEIHCSVTLVTVKAGITLTVAD